MKRLIFFLLLFGMIPSVQAATIETFVSPDCSFQAFSDFIDAANASLLLSAYTFSSPEMTDDLISKHSNGTYVELIVEKSPVGGMSDYEISTLCALRAGNVTVMLYDGPLRFMHAKYAIRDGKDCLISSENYGYSGFIPGGQYGNRGWGVIVYGSDIANELEDIFSQDINDSVPFVCPAGGHQLHKWNIAGAYEPRFGAQTFDKQKAMLIYSPDSLDDILQLIGSASSYILVDEFYIYTHWGSPSKDSVQNSPNPLLEALINKARQGVWVKILLDSTYYEMDRDKSTSNYNTIEYVNSAASDEGIPIEARAMDLNGHGIKMLHNKGMVIDGKKALISSINWNENSVMKNREVGIIIQGEAAKYYENVFYSDWNDRQRDYGLGFTPAMVSLAGLLLVIFYFSMRKIKQHPGVDL